MATLTAPPIEQLFQGLADRTRLRLLNLMADQEVCVCYFVEILGLSQPVISRHLAYLRARGLVTSRRQGKWMHYRIAPQATPLAAQLLPVVLHGLATDAAMRRERAQLVRACCSPKAFTNLKGAPRPTAICCAAPAKRIASKKKARRP
jgi:ArsR family transcriptional regulator